MNSASILGINTGMNRRVLDRMILALALSALAAMASATSLASQPHRVVYIENQDIRLGMDLDIGGAITYLAPATNHALNVINSYDWGRQVQFSFYSGPVPYQPSGSKLSESWRFLGWNPIQSGDCYGHQSRVLKYSCTRDSLYVKCVPMQWPLDNIPAESEGEVWLKLDGPVVQARCRLTNHRADLTQYPARTQELPAVYVNAPFHHLLTYRGSQPFTDGPLSEMNARLDRDGRWDSWSATEHWAAEVNDQNWGLGVWSPTSLQFSGGFFSEPGQGGPTDPPTGYLAPNQNEILDHNIVYEYRYELILGTLSQIHNYAYTKAASLSSLPHYNFKHSREGWYYADATDTGWPVHGELNIQLSGQHPQILGPEFFIPAVKIKQLQLTAAFSTGTTNATLFWRKLDEHGFATGNSTSFAVQSDNSFHVYRVPLASSANFTGNIIQFRLDPIPEGKTNASVRIKSIRCE